MQYSLSIVSIVALFSAATAKPVDSDNYRVNFAAIQTERINSYKQANGATLTPEQNNVLTLALDIVSSQDRSRLAGLRDAAKAAFTKDDAIFILSGVSPTSKNDAVTKRNLLRRAKDCNCSTDDNYCNDSQYCQYNSGNCNFNAGCGTLWLEECDGRCVKK